MSFPGKVIENLWFVSLSCLRTQVLVPVPNFFWIYFWKWDQRLRAGLDRAREVPIGFLVQRLNHWVFIAILTLILFWWNPIPSSDKFLLVLVFDFLLRVVVVVVSKRCRLHVLSRKVIENLWFVSLSCLRTQVLVFVRSFFWISFWKMRSKAASRARSCAGSSHWISSPTP